MSRESRLKTASASLQPRSLDLTQHAKARVASRVQSTQLVPTDEAAYALGFATQPVEIDGIRYAGDPLGVVLLRLKYARQLSTINFAKALGMLLEPYGGLGSCDQVMRAVGACALVEWVNDRCEKCRGRRQDVKVAYCSSCGFERVPDGRRVPLPPQPGCAKCGGMGRIFTDPKPPRGMACAACGNSGLVTWSLARRHRRVDELVVEERKSLGQEPTGIDRETFKRSWADIYFALIGRLRDADRRMGAAIDFGYAPGENRAIESGREEEQDGGDAHIPIESSDVLQEHEPEESTGEVPSQES